MDARFGAPMSRRRLLAALGLGGVITVVPAARVLAAPGSRNGQSTTGNELSLARFTPHVGQRMTMNGGTQVVLEEAAPRAPSPADGKHKAGECFSLIFRAQSATALRDGTYTIAHPDMGTVQLFVVAVGSGRAGQGFQAVVDRR